MSCFAILNNKYNRNLDYLDLAEPNPLYASKALLKILTENPDPKGSYIFHRYFTALKNYFSSDESSMMQTVHARSQHFNNIYNLRQKHVFLYAMAAKIDYENLTEMVPTLLYLNKLAELRPLKIHQDTFDIALTETPQAFQKDRELGLGSFGSVALFTHQILNRPYAIKVLNAKEDAKVEIEALARFNHNNLVKLYHYDGNTKITLEYLKGTTFKYAFNLANEEQKKDLIKQLLEALAYMHDQGFVHRDLKNENIKVVAEKRSDGSVKLRLVLIDFNLTRRYKDSPSKRPQGTPLFMSSEALNCIICPQVDSWAAGILLHYVLTGYHPLEGDKDCDNQAIMLGKLRKLRANPESVTIDFKRLDACAAHPELKEIIKNMLTIDYTQRPIPSEILTHTYFRD